MSSLCLPFSYLWASSRPTVNFRTPQIYPRIARQVIDGTGQFIAYKATSAMGYASLNISLFRPSKLHSSTTSSKL